MSEETVRMKFAYLAGLGSPEWRREMKAVYAAMHKAHTKERYADCAECDMADINDMIDGKTPTSRLLKLVRK